MQNSEPTYLENYFEDTEENEKYRFCFPEPSGYSGFFAYFEMKSRTLKNKHLVTFYMQGSKVVFLKMFMKISPHVWALQR